VDCRTVPYASGKSGTFSKPRLCIGCSCFAIQIRRTYPPAALAGSGGDLAGIDSGFPVMKTLYPNYLCMAASIVLSGSAQLFMKAGMVLLSNASTGSSWMEVITGDSVGAVTWVALGLLCYAFSLFFWMYAISRLELSFAYPMLSLSYVLVYLVASYWPLLGEQISPIRGAGIAIIIYGVYLISRSKSKNIN